MTGTLRIPETRAEYVEQLAFRESISYSLNVTDFGEFLRISTPSVTDKQVLRIMHSTIARSKFIPGEIKLESKTWLVHMNQIESRILLDYKVQTLRR